MPREKKFNKRGGGPRLDAISAEEIEIRNAQLAALEDKRAARRAADSDEEAEEEAEEKPDQPPVPGEATQAASSQPSNDKNNTTPAPQVITTQADHNRNMERLAQVRLRREQAAARRKEEEEAAALAEVERQQQLAATLDDDGKSSNKKNKNSIPKLDKITIKKMKPAKLKEALKERGLDIQGNAKTLVDRLLQYETAR